MRPIKTQLIISFKGKPSLFFKIGGYVNNTALCVVEASRTDIFFKKKGLSPGNYS